MYCAKYQYAMTPRNVQMHQEMKHFLPVVLGTAWAFIFFEICSLRRILNVQEGPSRQHSILISQTTFSNVLIWSIVTKKLRNQGFLTFKSFSRNEIHSSYINLVILSFYYSFHNVLVISTFNSRCQVTLYFFSVLDYDLSSARCRKPTALAKPKNIMKCFVKCS